MSEFDPTPDDASGMDWWNKLDKVERAYWLLLASTATPVDAWTYFKASKRQEAGTEALNRSLEGSITQGYGVSPGVWGEAP